MRVVVLLLAAAGVAAAGCKKKDAAGRDVAATPAAVKPSTAKFDSKHLNQLMSRDFTLAELEAMFGPATRVPLTPKQAEWLDSYYVWFDATGHKIEAGYKGTKQELLSSTPKEYQLSEGGK